MHLTQQTEETESAGCMTHHKEQLREQFKEEDTKVISKQTGLTARRGSAPEQGLTAGF